MGTALSIKIFKIKSHRVTFVTFLPYKALLLFLFLNICKNRLNFVFLFSPFLGVIILNWIDNISNAELLELKDVKALGKLPKHIAIIMDGNGRWAVNKEKPRIAGHREGIESVRAVVRTASNIGIRNLTLYAFSIENWKRPASEVSGLMKLLELFLKKELNELHENNVRITTIGKTNALPKGVQSLLRNSIEKTKDNEGMNLVLALSYGGRWDILRAVQMMALDVRRGKLSPEDITEETFSLALQTATTPDPDLIIRTSGEFRISNFLLWESAYSEYYISDKLWPEFRKNEFLDALRDYANRERRFGKTSSQVSGELNSTNYFQRVVDAFKK